MEGCSKLFPPSRFIPWGRARGAGWIGSCDPEFVYRQFPSNVRFSVLNPLTPNDSYRGRTAPLTSKVAFYIFIQQI